MGREKKYRVDRDVYILSHINPETGMPEMRRVAITHPLHPDYKTNYKEPKKEFIDPLRYC